MPSNDNFRTCICEIMQAHHSFRRLLAHCETFCILSNFEQFWANLSNFEQFWSIFGNFRQFFRACLGHLGKNEHFCRASVCHVEQFWTIFGSTIWHCWPWTMFKMSQMRLLWDILLWLKKVADYPTDLDPKTSYNEISEYCRGIL